MQNASAQDIVARLDRIARMDGYRVKAASSGPQAWAWKGHLGVFQGDSLVYAANRPDNVRGFLHARTK